MIEVVLIATNHNTQKFAWFKFCDLRDSYFQMPETQVPEYVVLRWKIYKSYFLFFSFYIFSSHPIDRSMDRSEQLNFAICYDHLRTMEIKQKLQPLQSIFHKRTHTKLTFSSIKKLNDVIFFSTHTKTSRKITKI